MREQGESAVRDALSTSAIDEPASRRAWVGQRRREVDAVADISRTRMNALPRASASTTSQRTTSRALHRLGALSAHAAAGAAAALFVMVWMIFGAAIGFPQWWQTVLYSVTASVTLVMVFAIQHTQSRLEFATQRKLDELLRAMPRADNELIAVEEAADAELAARTELNREDRSRAVQPKQDRTGS